jgi:hypothetical protein
MIRDEAQNSLSRLFDLPLGEADELDIIVLKPLRILFAEWLPIHLLILFDEVADEGQDPSPDSSLSSLLLFDFPWCIGGVARIGWIPQDHQNRSLLLDRPG